MTTPAFDRDSWDRLWVATLRDRGEVVAQRPPSPYLTDAAAGLRSGTALDAGCGHGAETMWLAARGWRVTALDFSASVLAHGRSAAETAGSEVAARIAWVESDLTTWSLRSGHYDLVTCLYVHVSGSVVEMVRRLASGVAPGGTLLLVGHRPVDPETGAATPAAGQVQVSVDAAVTALDGRRWDLVVAEERERAVTGSGVDAVVRARRRA